jgi:UDP-N-acetylmuramyl pentapeptide synthase
MGGYITSGKIEIRTIGVPMDNDNRTKEQLEQTEVTEVTVTSAQLPPASPRKKLGEGKWWRIFLEPGSAVQIVGAALVAVAIGMAVNATVEEVPAAAVAIVGIPGRLWLRALQAVGEDGCETRS